MRARPTAVPYDCIVLTCSNATACAAAAGELPRAVRRALGPSAALPALVCVADPLGRRVGSGGGTLNALAAAEAALGAATPLARARVLVVHSGGDSQRAPLQSVLGKAWCALPSLLHADDVPATPIELLVELLCGPLCDASLPRGACVVSCSDVILKLPPGHVLGLGADGRLAAVGLALRAPSTYGPHHGVYLVGSGSGEEAAGAAPCSAYLQKAPVPVLEAAGAVDASGDVLVDTGVVLLGPAVVGALMRLAKGDGPLSGTTEAGAARGAPAVRFELYSDVLLALAGSGLETDADYFDMASTLPDAARTQLRRALGPLRLGALAVPADGAAFCHLGTSAEQAAFLRNEYAALTAPLSLRRMAHAAPAPAPAPGAAAAPLLGAGCALVNALVGPAVAVGDGAVLEHCALVGSDGAEIGRGAFVSGVRSLPGGGGGRFVVPPRAQVQEVTLDAGAARVLVTLGLDDPIKTPRGGDGARVCGAQWADLLAALGAQPAHVWPDGGAETLWTAKLFPVLRGGVVSVAAPLATCLLRCAGATTSPIHPLESGAAWRAAERLSLQDVLARADRGAEFAWRHALEARVADAHAAQQRATSAGACTAVSAFPPPAERCRGAPLEFGEWAAACAPARVDLSGGWTDTPPLSWQRAGGGRVVTVAVAVDGRRPILARCRRLRERVLVFTAASLGAAPESLRCACASDLKDVSVPGAPFQVHKAACVLAEIVDAAAAGPAAFPHGAGIEIETYSALPRGSGMGTSSILSGCVLAAVGRALGAPFSPDELVHAVVAMEAMMGTGGGWQDQAGGLLGGVRMTESAASLPLRVRSRLLAVPAPLDAHLTLVYTGEPRLARDLLASVTRGWALREPHLVEAVDALAATAAECEAGLSDGDLAAVGRCLDAYAAQKCAVAPGTLPPSVKRIVDVVRGLPGVLGVAPCGAGGGGFLCVLGGDRAQVAAALERGGCTGASVHAGSVEAEGVRVGGAELWWA